MKATIKRFSLNLPKQTYERIKTLAKRDRRSVTQEIVMAIEFWMANRVDVDFGKNEGA